MRESFLKRLFSRVECGVCGKKYDLSDIKILDHEDDLWFLSVSCSSCGTRGLIAAVVRDGGVAEVINDLTEAEHDLFAESEAVGLNDVLDMHVFLDGFGGDFESLFPKE